MELEIIGIVTQETASMVRNELSKDSTDMVDVLIDSPGGDLLAGLSIYNMLRERNTRVFVNNVAGSIASVIALAGVIPPAISETGSFHIHNAHVSELSGNHNDLRRVANTLEKYSNIIADIYADRTNLSKDMALDAMSNEVTFNAQEAALFGFASESFKPVAALQGLHKLDNKQNDYLRIN